MTTVQRSLLYTALAFAVIFVVSQTVTPYPGHFAVKAIPAIALSILALTAVSGLTGKLLSIAFLFCALSFILSDSLIAIDKFTISVPASSYVIMTTYYLAIFLIAYGYVRSDRA